MLDDLTKIYIQSYQESNDPILKALFLNKNLYSEIKNHLHEEMLQENIYNQLNDIYNQSKEFDNSKIIINHNEDEKNLKTNVNIRIDILSFSFSMSKNTDHINDLYGPSLNIKKEHLNFHTSIHSSNKEINSFYFCNFGLFDTTENNKNYFSNKDQYDKKLIHKKNFKESLLKVYEHSLNKNNPINNNQHIIYKAHILLEHLKEALKNLEFQNKIHNKKNIKDLVDVFKAGEYTISDFLNSVINYNELKILTNDIHVFSEESIRYFKENLNKNKKEIKYDKNSQ